MKKSIEKYCDKISCLHDLADILIKEDRIQEGGIEVLKNCHESLHGDGASNFLTHLMAHCNKNQIKDVRWLVEECMPIMYPVFMEVILKAFVDMYIRYNDVKNIGVCVERIQKRWKEKGIIRKSFVFDQLYRGQY